MKTSKIKIYSFNIRLAVIDKKKYAPPKICLLSFLLISSKDVRPMTCNGVKSSSATHKNNDVKSSVNLTWEAPEIQVMEFFSFD